MNKSIEKSEAGQYAKPLAPTVAAKRYEQALTDLKSAIYFGFRKQLLTAITLADVRHHKLYLLDKKRSFEEFYEEIGMSKSSAHRFADIGEMLREGVKRFDRLDAPPQFVTWRDVSRAFAPLIANGSEITLRGLGKASANYDEFEKYLNGAGEEAPAQKLIEGANKQSIADWKKGPALAEQWEPETEIARKREYAKERGWVYDEEEHCFTHPGGAPLTPEEEVELIPTQMALQPLDLFSQSLSFAVAEVERTVKTHKEMFAKYRTYANDSVFHNKMLEQASSLRARIVRLQELLGDLLAEEAA